MGFLLAIYLFFIILSTAMIVINIGKVIKMDEDDKGLGLKYGFIVFYTLLLTFYITMLINELTGT